MEKALCPTTKAKKYFDLHTAGISYVNCALEVTPKEGSHFLNVTISALRGNVENVQYTHFECRVPGKQAQEIVRQVKPAAEDKLKVLIGFTLSVICMEIPSPLRTVTRPEKPALASRPDCCVR